MARCRCLHMTCVLVVSATACSAQEPARLYDYLNNGFSQPGKGTMPWNERVALMKQANPHELLASLDPYLKSDDVGLRSRAVNVCMVVSDLHPTGSIRRKVVDKFVRGLVNPEAPDLGLRWKYSTFLRRFEQIDYSDAARKTLLDALDVNEPPSKELIRVCGVAQLKQTLPRLAELVFDEKAFASARKRRGDPKWYRQLGWHARLARARMGVQADIDRCLEMVDTVENTHDLYSTLLYQVAYIRSPESVEYLKKYFLSDLRLEPTNPGRQGELVTKYLVPPLARALEGFPLPVRDGRRYKSEELEQARKWMAAQNQWKIRK